MTRHWIKPWSFTPRVNTLIMLWNNLYIGHFDLLLHSQAYLISKKNSQGIMIPLASLFASCHKTLSLPHYSKWNLVGTHVYTKSHNSGFIDYLVMTLFRLRKNRRALAFALQFIIGRRLRTYLDLIRKWNWSKSSLWSNGCDWFSKA